MREREGRRVVAAFDFDGTLTRRDTLLPFLRYLCGQRAVTAALARHVMTLAAAIAFDRQTQRDVIKEQVLRELLAGRQYDDVRAVAERFARHLAQTSQLHADLVSRWRWHAGKGHDIVLVSASLEAYVGPFARGLGDATVLATRLATDARGTLTGDVHGFNCRGAEKVRRLREWGLDSGAELWAYGDSSGDRELLAVAHVPHHVGRGGRVSIPRGESRRSGRWVLSRR